MALVIQAVRSARRMKPPADSVTLRRVRERLGSQTIENPALPTCAFARIAMAQDSDHYRRRIRSAFPREIPFLIAGRSPSATAVESSAADWTNLASIPSLGSFPQVSIMRIREGVPIVPTRGVPHLSELKLPVPVRAACREFRVNLTEILCKNLRPSSGNVLECWAMSRGFSP
jgi:hypothetical protein